MGEGNWNDHGLCDMLWGEGNWNDHGLCDMLWGRVTGMIMVCVICYGGG